MNNEILKMKKHIAQLNECNQKLDKNMQKLNRITKINGVSKALEGWIYMRELLEMLGISRSTVYRFMGNGKLAYSKFGSRLIFKVEDVLEIIESNYKRFESKDEYNEFPDN